MCIRLFIHYTYMYGTIYLSRLALSNQKIKNISTKYLLIINIRLLPKKYKTNIKCRNFLKVMQNQKQCKKDTFETTMCLLNRSWINTKKITQSYNTLFLQAL